MTITRHAVGSYPAFSTLPAEAGGIFSATLSVATDLRPPAPRLRAACCPEVSGLSSARVNRAAAAGHPPRRTLRRHGPRRNRGLPGDVGRGRPARGMAILEVGVEETQCFFRSVETRADIGPIADLLATRGPGRLAVPQFDRDLRPTQGEQDRHTVFAASDRDPEVISTQMARPARIGCVRLVRAESVAADGIIQARQPAERDLSERPGDRGRR